MRLLPPPHPTHGCALCLLSGRAPAVSSRAVTRRLFTAALLGGGLAPAAWADAQPGPADSDAGLRGDVGGISRAAQLVPAAEVEAGAAQQYAQLKAQAAAQRALLAPEHPQVQRLQAVARRIIQQAPPWNDRARRWQWEVNLLNSKELNAFCMPGGKIAFYTGILRQLRLDDDEVAAVMGHEMAHALREHARERIGKSLATRGLFEIGASLFGLGQVGRTVAGIGEQLVNLRFSREDETEADLVGLDLAARAGYDPEAGVRIWQKMMAASQGAPPQWMSTHPASDTRIRDIQAKLPKVLPLYQRAAKPQQRFEPMA